MGYLFAKAVDGELLPVDDLVLGISTGFIAAAGVVAAQHWMVRSLGRDRTETDEVAVIRRMRRERPRGQQLAKYLGLYSPVLVIVGVGVWLPGAWTTGTLLTLAVFGPVLVWLVMGGRVDLAPRLGGMAPAPEEVRRRIHEMADRYDIRLDGVYVMPEDSANAYAYTEADCIVFTDLAVELESEEELVATGAHEPDHLAEVGSRAHVVGAGVAVAAMAFDSIQATVGLAELLYGAGALAVVSLLFMSSGRDQETSADQRVSEDAEVDNAAFARSLETSHRVGMMPAVVDDDSRRHPNLYERMQRLGVEPAYKRPSPPPKRQRWIVMIVGMLAVGVLLTGFFVGARQLGDEEAPHATSSQLRMVLSGVRVSDLEELGDDAMEREAYEEAAAYFGAAYGAWPRIPSDYSADAARAAAKAGECEKAQHYLDELGGSQYTAPGRLDLAELVESCGNEQ